jgi:uncharacterized protein DUF5361
LDQHLMAIVADRLAVANWQRSKDGQKGTRRPKPISPLARKGRSSTYGKTSASSAEVQRYLKRLKAGEFEGIGG